MGIKDLWSILNPYCKRKPLYELQGKVVAIDLAGWICESLCVVDYQVQARFYLRYSNDGLRREYFSNYFIFLAVIYFFEPAIFYYPA